MSTNSKEIQKRADNKRKNRRAANWEGILYPESAPDNWMERIENSHVDVVVSPLHDKDFDNDGVIKKPHYHLLLLGNSAISRDSAADMFESWGAVVQKNVPPVGCQDKFIVRNKINAARYLCHLTTPGKYQYNIDDVVVFGNIDYKKLIKYDSLVSEKYDNNDVISEIHEIMKENFLISYPDIYDWCYKNRQELICIVNKHRKELVDYAKGLYFRAKNGLSF